MQAIVLETYGGAEVLQLAEVPDPVCGPADVLVEVVSTAVNRADVMQRQGFYPGPAMEHEIPGLEFAGRVGAAGQQVTGVAVGDAVMGIVGGGGYAQRVAVHHRQVMAVPDRLPLADAGAVPEVWLTAFDALVLQGGLASGDVALVHAGASGVGTAAIQIARAVGAQVVVTCSADKAAACETLGAIRAVDRRAQDFVAEVLEVTDGRGADVVLDVVGGDYLNWNVKCAAPGGRIIQVGTMSGGKAQFTLAQMMTKRLTLIGTVLRPRPVEEKIALTRSFAHQMLPRFADGTFSVVVDSRFPLQAAAAAHERMESDSTVGKIILDVASDSC